MDLSDWVASGLISPQEAEVYRQSGYGRRSEPGSRPAVLVVDVSYNFTGDRPEPVLESIKKFRNSCGEEAWKSISHIQRLLAGARARGVPVIYTTRGYRVNPLGAGAWARKNTRTLNPTPEEVARGDEIVKEVAPKPNDLVIYKDKPSAFFATPLVSYLNQLGIDTVIVCGGTTSGCIRATVVDAFSYNYGVVVPKECVFDRSATAHQVNLFDIQMKYGEVMETDAVLAYLGSLEEALLHGSA